MKLFAKVKSFFSKLFCGKKKESITDEESKVKKCIEIEIDNSEEEEQEEESVEEKHLAIFSDKDKDGIIDILRPIIKSLNSDSLYIEICSIIAESKVLKTFATLSEDKKTLTINLTQNNVFNKKISEFISDHVVATFQSKIDAEMLGEYEIKSTEEGIQIHKIN